MTLDAFTSNSRIHDGANPFGQSAEHQPLCLLSICDTPQTAQVADQPANRAALQQRVSGLLTQLDSSVYRERMAAQRDLLQLGRDSLPMLEAELRNPRSLEVSRRVQDIYRQVSGSERIEFQGNLGRDGVGRLREVRNEMQIYYRDGVVPARDNQISQIDYPQARVSLIRQNDGTYTMYRKGYEMHSGMRVTLNQANGSASAVLRDGTTMDIPTTGPGYKSR